MSNNLHGFRSKKLLALVRDGDFAHPGEVDAIALTLDHLFIDDKRQLLDVGCGLGGTAGCVQGHGWGKVTGIDIDKDCIAYAQKKYPSVEFHVGDVVNVADILPQRKFDVIYLFNSFFAFPDQLAALKALHTVAKPNAQLVLFDYSNLTKAPIKNPAHIKTFTPIIPSEIESLLKKSGWKLTEIKDISKEYESWYQQFLKNLAEEQQHIAKEFSESDYQAMQQRYVEIYEAIQKKHLGGCIVYAKKS